MDYRISIHAPQWGATVNWDVADVLSCISIHAPQWGATRRISYWRHRQAISIHAPQWGATMPAHLLFGINSISIHAPQWGATGTADTTNNDEEFQSTHPSGVRLPISPKNSRLYHFNPRTPVGCDAQWSFGRRLQVLFQSTHPSGVRLLGNRKYCGVETFISIHAPQWGATYLIGHLRFLLYISIHAPQWGATPAGSFMIACFIYFNPRTPVGCDLQHLCFILVGDISIHAPQWGATRTCWHAVDA